MRRTVQLAVRHRSLKRAHWFYLIDRHWSGDEDEIPPSWARVGRWRSDQSGEIVTWEPNPNYRPSPDAHGWGPPAGDADAASQLVATGYESPVMLPVVLADAEVSVLLDEEGNPTVVEGPGGRPAVPVFSASPRPTDDLPMHEVMSMPTLLDRMPEGSDVLFLSSSAPACQTIAPAALRAARELVERYEGKGSEVPTRPGADRAEARRDATPTA
ncbi:type VII secretion system-associated protein [Streptomyces sp. NPDC004976]